MGLMSLTMALDREIKNSVGHVEFEMFIRQRSWKCQIGSRIYISRAQRRGQH